MMKDELIHRLSFMFAPIPMEQVTLKTQNEAVLAERGLPWNPQKYYVDNLFLSLGVALVSMLLILKFFGSESFIVFFMITSHVHFLTSYLFHYNVLRKTLTTRRKKLFFFLSFFPLVITFPLIYYEWVPVGVRGFLFMTYFITHMIRDEHVFYVQRSSDFKRHRLDQKVQAHMIFTILAFTAVLYANYTNGLALMPELQTSFYRTVPTWTFHAWLGVALVWGISSLYLINRQEQDALLPGAIYASGIVGLIFLYHEFAVTRISISQFNKAVIFYHYIAWYLFSLERVLYYRSPATGLEAQVSNPEFLSSPPAGYRGDPFWKFKHSLPHFLGLLLTIHLLLLALYGISCLESFRFLDVLFKAEYIALWSFPHITLHFYPKR